jgi:Uma2 family endonuclease
MPVSEQTYLQLVLEDPESKWELHCGRLRSKPNMTAEHGDLILEVGYHLRRQLDRAQFRVRANHGQVRRSEGRIYVPDVMVVPTEVEQQQRAARGPEVYTDPLPLVVEIWSPSTGDYDVREKLPEYQRRGDAELWLIHPSERTLTAWRRQPDNSYTETVYRGGTVRPVALPNVTIDLDELFNL